MGTKHSGKIVVFGWHELSECSYGISQEVIDPEDFGYNLEFDEAGRLCYSDLRGEWFHTFTQAKRAQLAELKQTLKWVRRAIVELKKQRKTTIGKF